MKRLLTCIPLLTLLFSYHAYALSGAYTIPGPKFPTIKIAIDSLNLYGLTGVAPVTFNITVGHTETAPSGGFVIGSPTLNASITPVKSFTLNGNGAVITANAGTGSTDGILIIQGTDFVTIDNLVLQESATNTTATTMMEWGVACVKYDVNDGINSTSIQNCEITLNKNNTTAAFDRSLHGSTGIFVGNCLATSSANLATGSVFGAEHSGIFLFKNKIKNVNHGIVAYGNLLNADGSTFNDKNLNVRQNTITNFTHEGIWLAFMGNTNVGNNIINNMSDGGAAPTVNHIYGIAFFGNVNTATNETWDCFYNNINLTTACNGTYEAYGIFTGIHGTGTTSIYEDTIKLTSTGTSAGLIGIYSQNDKGTQVLRQNYLNGFSNTSTNMQRVAGIYIGYSATWALAYPTLYNYPTLSTIDTNTFTGFDVYSSALDNIGIVHICSDNNLTTSPTSYTRNIISNITVRGNASRFFGYGSTYLIGGTMTQTANIEKNLFTKISLVASSTPSFILWPRAAYNGRTSVVNNNRISNITGSTGRLMAIALDYGTATTVTNDTITDITGSADVYGIYAGSSPYAIGTISMDKNTISNITAPGTNAIATGIRIDPGSSNLTTAVTINKTLCKSINASGTGGTAYGIHASSGSFPLTLTTNFISDIVAAANTASYSSSFGINLSNTGSNNVYFNTVNLETSTGGGTGYGATGMLYNTAGTNKIQNNILRVNVAAGAANNVTAMRATSGAALLAPSSSAFSASSNIYYTPQGANKNNYLYVEGTTNLSLVNGYAIAGLTANTTKNFVNDTFFNSECDRSSYHKFMKTGLLSTREVNTFSENNLTGTGGVFVPSGMSFAEARAIDGSVSLDFTDAPRPSGSSDIGALEFNGTTQPKMDIKIVSSTGFDTACTFNLPTLIATIPTYFNRVSFQWYRDTTKIVGATSKLLTVLPVSEKYILKVYDSLTGCEYASEIFRMTIVPPPPALISYYDSLIFCETSAIVLQSNKGSGYIYQWLRNGIPLPLETKDHLVADKSGDYTVEVNTALGCPTVSTAIRVKVYPLPTPVIYYVIPRVLGVTQTYFTYQWYKNNVKIPAPDGEGFRLYTTTDGAYTVEVTDSNGCTAKSEIFLYSLGVDETSVSAAIKVYPNPATDRLVIDSPIPVTVVLSDLAGRTIISQQNANVLDVRSVSEGLYLLTLMDKEGKTIKVQKINIIK